MPIHPFERRGSTRLALTTCIRRPPGSIGRRALLDLPCEPDQVIRAGMLGVLPTSLKKKTLKFGTPSFLNLNAW